MMLNLTEFKSLVQEVYVARSMVKGRVSRELATTDDLKNFELRKLHRAEIALIHAEGELRAALDYLS